LFQTSKNLPQTEIALNIDLQATNINENLDVNACRQFMGVPIASKIIAH